MEPAAYRGGGHLFTVIKKRPRYDIRDEHFLSVVPPSLIVKPTFAELYRAQNAHILTAAGIHGETLCRAHSERAALLKSAASRY